MQSAGMTSQPVDATDLNETQFQFDRGLRWLHWTMAALIFVAIVLGVASAYLPVGQQPRKGLLEIHKSLGITILALVMVRLAWRLWTGEPAYRRPLGRLTHIASRAGHCSLYGLMIFMPITGYLFSAAGGYSLPWFGLLQWPRLLPHDTGIANWGEVLHDRGAWVITGVLLLHLAAVGWHRWIKRDDVLSRMTG
jgi:cytochrome b561